jgi:Zn finger protein HypA/HybF involved in hydrogenase expression
MEVTIMPKIGVTKTPKTFTLSISTLAWLDEYCIRTGKKMSPVVDGLINQLRKQEDDNKSTQFWCTSCSKETDREWIDNKPYCTECGALDNALLRARKMFQS